MGLSLMYMTLYTYDYMIVFELTLIEKQIGIKVAIKCIRVKHAEELEMLLEKYEQDQLLFNVNFKEKTAQDGIFAYRGELVLTPGEIADGQGRTKPPIALVRSVVMLEKNEKILFFVGIIDSLDLLTNFIEKYKDDFADDMSALMYVVNITESMYVEIDGVKFMLIPLVAGVAWNELIDELALEKSDFKGQSSGDKIVTAYQAFLDHKPKYPAYSWEQAQDKTADIKRELLGAV